MKCKKAGKPGVTVLVFPDQNGANLALSSGRAQLGFADSPVVEYQVKKSGGTFKLVGTTYRQRAVRPGRREGGRAQKALLAALEELMKDGQYKAILTHWGSRPARSEPQDQRGNQLARCHSAD